MTPRLVVMVDAGFLIRAGCATLGVRVDELALDLDLLVVWCRVSAQRMGAKFARMYWYDAIQENTQSEGYLIQKARADQVRKTPGVQIRLGTLVERPNPDWSAVRKVLREIDADWEQFKQRYPMEKKIYQQKGVDTLLVLDMVRLAQLGAYDELILVAGDADLAEAIRSVQEYGKRVTLAYPENSGNLTKLLELADLKVTLTADTLRRFLQKPDESD